MRLCCKETEELASLLRACVAGGLPVGRRGCEELQSEPLMSHKPCLSSRQRTPGPHSSRLPQGVLDLMQHSLNPQLRSKFSLPW